MIDDTGIRAFRETLIAGGYNLLFGAGISLDSTDHSGNTLPSTEELRVELCRLTGVNQSNTLTRVAPLLTSEQRERVLVKRFAGCKPGSSVSRLGNYVWRRAFTFNIDDVVEVHYEDAPHSKQTLETINYDGPFQPTPERDKLFLVHLHGFARQPDTPFVFSTTEYAHVIRGLNPWMHLLAEIMATEPFIIAGTTLNEVDLAFYLTQRNANTPRRGTGPSLLIEPFPDAATRADCERHGLTLVEATLEEFMRWVNALVPSPPSVGDLYIPDTVTLFGDNIDKRDLLRFFSDFELVAAADQPLPDHPTPFLYGREPGWSELNQHLDISRALTDRIAELLDLSTAQSTPIVVVIDEAGTGKSTVIRRIAHSRARLGQPIISVRTFSGIDTRSASRCLSALDVPTILLVDDLADHATQIADLLGDPSVLKMVTVLAAERRYRKEYLDLTFGETDVSYVSLPPFTENEYQQLIERYRQFGLIGDSGAIASPQQFARQLQNDVVAIAICRILNDFRPFDSIVDSLWQATDPALRTVYLSVCLAYHCQRSGLQYSLTQAVAGPWVQVRRLFDDDAPLRLTDSVIDNDYVTPLNTAVAERLLLRIARAQREVMQNAFQQLANALAPYVNRRAIISRSPEARLAGRLFNAEGIVKPLLGSAAAEFYATSREAWEWNARFWEQRALLTMEDDLDLALRYARHAVSVERHPFPLTTLAKVLFATMDADSSLDPSAYAEGLETLREAIELERAMSRLSAHPFTSLLSSTSRFIELGGTLTQRSWQLVERYANEADTRFPHDPTIRKLLGDLDEVLNRA